MLDTQVMVITTLLAGAHFVDNPNGEGRVLQNVRGEENYGHVLVDLPATFTPVKVLKLASKHRRFLGPIDIDYC